MQSQGERVLICLTTGSIDRRTSCLQVIRAKSKKTRSKMLLIACWRFPPSHLCTYSLVFSLSIKELRLGPYGRDRESRFWRFLSEQTADQYILLRLVSKGCFKTSTPLSYHHQKTEDLRRPLNTLSSINNNTNITPLKPNRTASGLYGSRIDQNAAHVPLPL